MTEEERPYRVADKHGEGWLRNGPDGTYTTYPLTNLGELTYDQLDDERGPLRPVVNADPEDSAQFNAALTHAGKKAMATFLVALHHTGEELARLHGSVRALTAGRPGSWEANLLRSHIVWLGEDIAPSRVDDAALLTVKTLLKEWTQGPTQVELAEGLPFSLWQVAEKAGGWDLITDQWLRGNTAIERWTASYRIHD
ncbi:hypothetical protein ACFZAM_32105 [Streptomyces sp. NPDC008079]|uniref:hypothetical protein n=1 Tax=Streptomyces sp. NPDC008079 TaxID=3364806 RepID=UPI0036E30A5A